MGGRYNPAASAAAALAALLVSMACASVADLGANASPSSGYDSIVTRDAAGRFAAVFLSFDGGAAISYLRQYSGPDFAATGPKGQPWRGRGWAPHDKNQTVSGGWL